MTSKIINHQINNRFTERFSCNSTFINENIKDGNGLNLNLEKFITRNNVVNNISLNYNNTIINNKNIFIEYILDKYKVIHSKNI
jgi:hypothetical protein